MDDDVRQQTTTDDDTDRQRQTTTTDDERRRTTTNDDLRRRTGNGGCLGLDRPENYSPVNYSQRTIPYSPATYSPVNYSGGYNTGDGVPGPGPSRKLFPGELFPENYSLFPGETIRAVITIPRGPMSSCLVNYSPVNYSPAKTSWAWTLIMNPSSTRRFTTGIFPRQACRGTIQ